MKKPMKRLVCLAMLSTAVLAPRTTVAQEEDAAEHRTSLSLRPSSTLAIGVWQRLSPRMEIGIEAGGLAGESEGEDDQGLESRTVASIEPAIKLFGAPGGTLRPYGIGGVFYNLQRFDFGGGQKATSSLLGVSLGAGLEWSPVARIRIGGHAGVRAAAVDGERTRFDENGPDVYEVSGWEASTFTSGLIVYYSF